MPYESDQKFAPGYEISCWRERRRQASAVRLRTTVTAWHGRAFRIHIDGGLPAWAWVSDARKVAEFRAAYRRHGVATYCPASGILSVGDPEVLLFPQVAAPGQRARSGQLLEEVFRTA